MLRSSYEGGPRGLLRAESSTGPLRGDLRRKGPHLPLGIRGPSLDGLGDRLEVLSEPRSGPRQRLELSEQREQEDEDEQRRGDRGGEDDEQDHGRRILAAGAKDQVARSARWKASSSSSRKWNEIRSSAVSAGPSGRGSRASSSRTRFASASRSRSWSSTSTPAESSSATTLRSAGFSIVCMQVGQEN